MAIKQNTTHKSPAVIVPVPLRGLTIPELKVAGIDTPLLVNRITTRMEAKRLSIVPTYI